MTSQKSYFNPKFARDSLKRSWPTAVLFVLLLFFTMPVALLISVQNVDMQYVNTEECLYVVLDIARCFSFAMALFAGVVFFRHMHNRVSAYYYHSLPITREAHYIHMLTTGFVCYTAALFLNTILCQIILIGNYKLDAAYSGMLWGGSLQNLLFYALFFVITMLAGALCGTSVVQLITTLVILYILPLTVVSLILLATEYIRYSSSSDYISFALAEKLSVGVRVFTSLDNGSVLLGVAENLLYVLLVLLVAFGGMLIFRHRSVERTNMPFIFPRFGSVVKYAVMVPATILAGIFFGNLMTGGSFLWTVFGYVCGALLTFMAVNAVTYKNARAMFRNLKGFVIYAVCATAVILVLGLDLLSLNVFIPRAQNLTSVTLESNNLTALTFTEEEGIEKLRTLGYAVQDFDLGNSEYYYAVEDAYEIDGNVCYVGGERRETIKLTFRQKFGPTLVKRYSLGEAALAAIAPQLRAIADDEGFADAYLAPLNDEEIELKNLYLRISWFSSSSYHQDWVEMNGGAGREYLDLKDALNASRALIDWSYFQSPKIGSLTLYGTDCHDHHRSLSYPLYLSDQKLSTLADSILGTSLLTRPYSEFFNSLYIINVENGRYIKLSSEDEYAAVLDACAGDSVTLFTETDGKYRILTTEGINADLLREQGYSEEDIAIAEEMGETYEYEWYRVLDGKLPAFVVDALN